MAAGQKRRSRFGFTSKRSCKSEPNYILYWRFRSRLPKNIYLIRGSYTISKIINFVKLLYQLRKQFGNQLIIHTHLTWALYLTFIIKNFIKFRHIHTEHSVTSRGVKFGLKILKS